MNEMTNSRSVDERLQEITSALENGLIVVDTAGHIVWTDEKIRKRVNGGLHDLPLPLAANQQRDVHCFITTVEVPLNGKTVNLCVLQETGAHATNGHDLIAAVESVMSDPSWFTRTIVEKLKAWRHAKQPSGSSSDLLLLTQREREILALICEGNSDAEMSRMLGLSQNTVRNHVASLYRKIGVNRRAAAIIWARERALTAHEFTLAGAGRRPARGRNGG